MKMFQLHEPPSKSARNIQAFEAEMEAELDRRALEIEVQGGMEHQKSLSRSSSTTSLNRSPRASPIPGSSAGSGNNSGSCQLKSSLKRSYSGELSESKMKSVRFDTASSSKQETATEKVTADKKPKELYDELYFDSDESEDGEETTYKKTKKETRRQVLTNDELFYDPMSDEKDQEWIDKQRKKSYGEQNCGTVDRIRGTPEIQNADSSPSSSSAATENHGNQKGTKRQTSLPTTDAVLNCPACFTTVCQDCQRHEVYVGQYRAMFVVNCLINPGETLRIPEKAPKKFRKFKNKGDRFTPTSSSDVFHPVICKVCRTQVAMYDSDEVYHFFNVLASQP